MRPPPITSPCLRRAVYQRNYESATAPAFQSRGEERRGEERRAWLAALSASYVRSAESHPLLGHEDHQICFKIRRVESALPASRDATPVQPTWRQSLLAGPECRRQTPACVLPCASPKSACPGIWAICAPLWWPGAIFIDCDGIGPSFAVARVWRLARVRGPRCSGDDGSSVFSQRA